MKTSNFPAKLNQNILGGLLAFLALNAFAGGYYGMTGAKGVPVEWLQGSPFSDYFIPSLFLFIIVGASALYAAIAVLTQCRFAPKAAFFCGSIVLLWLITQLAIIGYVSWMQPATAAIAMVILLLTWQLTKYGY